MADPHDPDHPRNPHDRRRRYRQLGWWREGTFVDDLRHWTLQRPDQLAVVGHTWETREGPDVTMTWAELAARVDNAAGGLLELGVGAGDRVAVLVVNTWEAEVVALACARVGAVMTPIFVATGAAELETVLARSGAKVAIAIAEVRGFRPAATITELLPGLPSLQHVVAIGGGGPAQAVDFHDHFVDTSWATKHPQSELDRHAPNADDVYSVNFTSGTTGEPKGVVHSYNTLYAIARSHTVPLQVGADDVLTTPCIFTGLGGAIYGLYAHLVSGATTVWADAFRPDDWLGLAERYGVTSTYFTPAVAVQLVDAQRELERPLELRHFVCGSTPVPSQLVTDAHDALGVPFLSLWGMTENGGVTLTRPDDPWDWAVSSDGSPVEWMQVRVVDDHDAPVPAGETGHLQVRGANQCVGYFNDDERYAELLHDGWFETGDLARHDGRGGIKFVGRTKDLINKGGTHVPGVQVEDALRRHPKVREVAVVGKPQLPLGEIVVAFVEPNGDPPTLDELHAHLGEQRMTVFYWPDELRIVGDFPRNATGKILKRELERRLRDEQAGAHQAEQGTAEGTAR